MLLMAPEVGASDDKVPKCTSHATTVPSNT
jgi:hypothetical protein